MFKTIDEEDSSVLYIENASTVQIKWEVLVKIEFTLEKTLTFIDVFYDVRNNLINLLLFNKEEEIKFTYEHEIHIYLL